MSKSHELIKKYDLLYKESKNIDVLNKAMDEISKVAKDLTDEVLDKVLYIVSSCMKNAYSRSDN